MSVYPYQTVDVTHDCVWCWWSATCVLVHDIQWPSTKSLHHFYACFTNTCLSASTIMLSHSRLCLMLMVSLYCSCSCIRQQFPHLLRWYHTCTIHRHNLPVDVHTFCVLCPQVLDTSAHLFLVQSLSKLAIFRLTLHWCGTYCTAEDSWHFVVGTCTNIWQRSSLRQSFVLQEYNRKTGIP